MIASLNRRKFLQNSSALGAATVMPLGALAAEGSKTLVIAAPATPQGIDYESDFSAGSQDCYANLYDTLVAFEKVPDPKAPGISKEDMGYYADKPGGLALRNVLAESFEVSRDGRKATFKLREGVRSNHGNLLSAEDVRYSWERKFKAGGVGGFFTTTLGLQSIDQVKVEGPQVVTFNLDKPNPLIVKLHTNSVTGVLDSKKFKEMATKDDPWAHKFMQNESAGFGPYRLKSLVRGQHAVFELRKDYWGEKPFFETVIMREVPASASRMSLLQGGAVDIAQFLSPREVNSLKNAQNLSLDAVDSSFMLWVHLNTKFRPFDNKQVRQAVNYLLPREEMVKSVFYGMASPMKAFMPKGYPMTDESFFSYNENVEKAKALLAEAGLAGGFKTTLSYDAASPVQESMALIFQTSLRRAGIEVTMEKLPSGVFFDAVSRRTKPMNFFLDMPMTPDANYASTLYFTKDSFVNYNGWTHPEVESQIAAARVEYDNAKRTAIYSKIQKALMDEAPWGLGVYPKFLVARKKEIKGYTQYASNTLRFADLRRA